MMKQVMLDIETMGTDIDAPIIQIGACYFSMKTGRTGDEFLINIDMEDAIKHGATPDGRTIYWWLGQSHDARFGLWDDDTPMLFEDKGLREFNEFWSRATRVWSHATFDFVMLMHAMRRRDIQPTVHYRSARDIRTLTGLVEMSREEMDMTKVDRPGTQHNGLDDALFQVAYCHECYKRINTNKFPPQLDVDKYYEKGYNDAERTYGNNN